MDQNQLKRSVAEAALKYIEDDMIVGVGTGSTVNYFIDALANIKSKIAGAVSSSDATTQRLKSHSIPVYDLNSVNQIPVYVDGADQVNRLLQLIKGGGGALTREKIVAACAKKFVCVVDESKLDPVFGDFPIAVEVIPMARSYVAREIVKLGGNPVYRENFVTDNGNIIIDLHNIKVLEPIKLEQTLNNITGVVCHGLFASRPADVVLVSSADGVKTYDEPQVR